MMFPQKEENPLTDIVVNYQAVGMVVPVVVLAILQKSMHMVVEMAARMAQMVVVIMLLALVKELLQELLEMPMENYSLVAVVLVTQWEQIVQ